MRVALVVTVVASLLSAANADTKAAPWSDGVSEGNKATATRLLEQGNALFLDKRYAEALAQYRDAVAAWDHPAIRFNIVRCLIQLDRPVEASENLKHALKYGAAPLEDQVYSEAVAYEKLLARQVADVTITCAQPGVEVRLDGKELARCPARETRQVSPGRHQVLGTGPDLEPRTLDVFVVGGEPQQVELTLRAAKGGLTMRGVGKVSLYSGGGLLLIASGLAIYAYTSYHAQFPDHCTESPTGGRPLCDPTGADVADRAVTFGNAATIIGGVGGLAVLTGTFLMLRHPADDQPRVVPTGSANSVGVALTGAF